ncbi:cyclic nucleotide-binding domain-containing protein [Desulfococcaceae bacterium HSG8]|nr:cyclic nucleotide-binding domain-containing protein [Desulfococcaceae bacterium HSG8]
MEHSEVDHILKACEFFKGLGKDDIKKIAGLCEVKCYDAGECIFQQNDFGEHIYIISEGYIFLERSRNLGERKGVVVIDALGKGRFMGCWSTLLGEPHVLMSSAVCQKPTTVVVMKGSALREMMLSNTALGFSILERFCFLLRDRIQAAYGALEKI